MAIGNQTMNIAQASQIIDKVRAENGFGLLEMLEIMTDEYRSGGLGYFRETYTHEERTAYLILMNGFREFFGENNG